MGATERAVTGVGRLVAVVVASTVLLGCSSTPPPPAEPGTTAAITRVGDDFLELDGDDIFGDVAAGGGSVWMATLEGLIQVDPVTMDATWHTDLAPGRNIVYAFDSLWVSVSSGVVRVDPTSLEEIATIRIAEPEGLAADEDSIWTSQHGSRVVLRIDPRTNKVVETIDVASTDSPLGAPMDPSVVDGDIWVAMGNGTEVVRIDGKRKVTRIDVEQRGPDSRRRDTRSDLVQQLAVARPEGHPDRPRDRGRQQRGAARVGAGSPRRDRPRHLCR